MSRIMGLMNAGILPVKRLNEAKRRLGPEVGEANRRRIARALLDDALGLLAAANFITWWIVSADPEVLDRARARGHRAVEDSANGLNAALELALAAAGAAGATSAMIVPVDVPLATADDLRHISDTGETSEVVLVPSRRDGGTNALYLRPPDLFAPAFGPGSLDAHVQSAQRLKLRCSVIDLPRVALDLDTIEDARDLVRYDEAGRSATAALLIGSGIP
jgi:2-phospho-L-lactate/phosphoenolpyruvate guanylyltransferase